MALLAGLLNIPAPAPSQPAPGLDVIPDDDIVLDMSHGAVAGEVVLRWTGGLPAFTVYRSLTPVAVVSPANNIGATGSAAWIDLPPAGQIFYYQVRGTGCASDAGCPTGHCVDSYCCDTACDSICQACNISGAEGTCIPIAAGENPAEECGPKAACDGTGACLMLDGVECSDDRECLSAVCGRFMIDADGDGYGAAGGITVQVCGDVPPPGYSATSTDCNDEKASIHPGAAEVVGDEIDQDCDGRELCYVDADEDGFHTSATVLSADAYCVDAGEANAAEPGGDCNDAKASIYPGAPEVIGDEVDQSCDGRELCYADADNDGFHTAATVLSPDADCADAGEANAAEPGGDCNDANTSINPAAAEVVGDEVDQNCDALETCYADTDNDGFRTTSTVLSADADCADPGEARAGEPAGDCNDASPSINPSATEVVGDEVDQNCDGREICFADADNDGYRTAATVMSTDADCADPGEARASKPAGDCNDAVASIHPGATEVVGDGLDQDCNGFELCFADGDGDGYHTASLVPSTDSDCTDPGEGGTTMPGGDCCDNSAQAHPGQTAYFTSASPCGYDYNCDGASTQQFPTLASGSIACHGSPPLCTADPGLGWIGIVPGCGGTANFQDCNTATCSTTIAPRTQSCH